MIYRNIPYLRDVGVSGNRVYRAYCRRLSNYIVYFGVFFILVISTIPQNPVLISKAPISMIPCT